MARRERHQAPGEKLRGELMHFTVKGQDYWGVGEVRTLHDGGAVKVTGKLLGCTPGDTVELEGVYETNKWGTSFKARSCTVIIPQDASGVIGWLAAKLPQVSKRRAEALVERHGVEGTWRVLDEGDIAALCSIDGITEARAQEILSAYREQKGDRDRVVRLKQWGMTDNQIARVVKAWGDAAEEKLRADPYQLMYVVDGFGWKRADEVARRMGVAIDAPARLMAGIRHAMDEASAAGHCFVTDGKLVALVAAKVCGVAEGPVWRALEELLASEDERRRLVRRGTSIYLPRLADAEGFLAEVFSERASGAQKGRAA